MLDYQATLTLHDPAGAHATLARTQRIRFLQDGVGAILDHTWGDGLITSYSNDAGSLGESFHDEGRRHFVIELRRRMGRGEVLAFEVMATVMVAFTRDEEWLETTIDHPVSRLRRCIVFPQERPCRRAIFSSPTRRASQQVRLPVWRLGNGRTVVHFDVPRPRADVPYTVQWLW